MKLRDSDGDMWVPDDGGWRCVSEGHYSWLPSREAVSMIWGPLSEVDDD